MLRRLGLCLGALLLPLLTACSGKPVERKVVYENSVYHWRTWWRSRIFRCAKGRK